MAPLASSGRTKRDYFRVISRKRPRGTLSSVGDPFVFRSQALSLSLSLSRPAPSRATLDTSLVPNLAPVLHGSRKASPPPSLPHSLRSRPGFRGELFGAREKIPRTAHDDESVTENDTCPVAVPRFSSTDRSNHFFFSLSLSRSR